MKSLRTYNKYDYFLIILISLQVFGDFGGALQPVRILTCLFIPYFFLSKKDKLIKIYRYEINFLIFFFAWGVILLPITTDIFAGIKELIYLLINFICIFLILLFSLKSVSPVKSIILGWTIFCILLFPISFLEIFYNYHLNITVIEQDAVLGGTSQLVVYSSTTFGNYNLFVIMLIFAFPFITANIILQTNRIAIIFLFIILCFLCFIVITNGSRAGILALAIGLLYFLYSYLQFRSSKQKKLIVAILVACSFFIFLKFSDSIFYTLLYRLEGSGFEDKSRTEIYNSTFEVTKEYLFLGTGPGNISIQLDKLFNLEIIAPHNLFLEILSQYGIFVFLGFIFLLIKNFLRNKNNDFLPKYIVILCLIFIPIISIINSTYLQGTNIWIFLACLIVIASLKRFKKYDL